MTESYKQPLKRGSPFDPGCPPLDDGVGINQELSSTGDEGCFMSFSARYQAGIERAQCLVPAKGCWQCRRVKRASQPSSPTGNVPLTFVLAAVIVERRKTGES